jgi:hypothetical protein
VVVAVTRGASSLEETRANELGDADGGIFIGRRRRRGTIGGATLPELGQLPEQLLVDRNIEENGGAAPMLGEDHGTLGGADLFEERRGIRPEFSDRANVLGRLESGYGGVLHDVRS